ncbi:MAG: glycosyltransferase family 2 protein [Thermoanaerobaculia bacterium]
MKLLIQIPAYNEEKTIAATIRELPRTIEGVDSVEVLVIDDGSSDATVETARGAGAEHVVRLLTHRGLAQAFLAGIDASLRLGADIIVNTDADNQYLASDIPKLIAPILEGKAEVVIGDRDVRRSAFMGPLKRALQRLGSWAVGRAAGLDLPDVTSGFRAFSREAAYQINVFNPFTYTLETIIQAGNRNLGVQSVKIGTNPPTRPSRLYDGMLRYVRKSGVTIFRVYALYKPLKTFFAIGATLFLIGFALGLRFLWFYLTDGSAGHVQSLILAAVLLIIGFQTALIGLVADLISVNRRLSEEVLIRLRKLDPQTAAAKRPRRRERGDKGRPGSKETPAETPQWVWLFDESKFEGELEESAEKVAAAQAPPTPEPPKRRRRRRRSGPRPGIEGRDHKHHARLEKGDDPVAESDRDDDQV